MLDEEEEEERTQEEVVKTVSEEVVPQISIHTRCGSLGFQTMRLMVMWERKLYTSVLIQAALIIFWMKN